MMMKQASMMIAILATLAGCNPPGSPTIQEQAHDRWGNTRAGILHGLATEHYNRGQLAEARTKIQEAIDMAPEFWPGRLLLGRIYIEQGQHTLAVDELAKAEDAMPKSAEVLYYLGVAQEKAGQPEDALESYRRSQECDPANMAPVIAAAEVMAIQGNVREALVYAEIHLDKAGSDPGIYELAGRLAMMQQEYASAAEYYQHARDLDFENAGYQEALARAQFFAGQYESALENLQTLTERKDYTPKPSLYTMLGDCCMATGRTSQARTAHLKATELDPADAGAWTNLAKSALALGDLPRAVLAARQALSLDGGSLDATMLLGYALLRDGQVARSLSVLKPAVQRYPTSAELLCVLGRAHTAAGNQAEAARCYAAALAAEPSNDLARELLTMGKISKAG